MPGGSGPTCCVPGCSTKWKTHHGQLSFHKLPADDRRCAQWLAKIPRDWRREGKADPLQTLNRVQTVVCSRHFVKGMFIS